MECIVPKCKNNVGVAFPTDPKKKQEWLKALKLFEATISTKSIVCLNHFNAQDILLVYDAGGKSSKMIKKGSVPSLVDNSNRKIRYEEFGDMCRICLTSSQLCAKITDTIKENISIAIAIKLCCSLNVQAGDGFPQDICSECLSELRSAHNIRVKCLESNAKLEMGNTAAIKRKRISMGNPDGAPTVSNRVAEPNKKLRKSDKQIQNLDETIENIKREIETRTDVTAQKTADNLLSVNDILDALNTEAKEKKKVFQVGLPKDIRIFQKKSDTPTLYENSKGTKTCSIRMSIQNSYFIEAEDYIYALGLLRNDIRTIHCINNGCNSIAEHRRIDDESYEDEILVEVAHNHKPLSKMEQKKEIFYYMIKKRMQMDKTMNIRHLYEQFCIEDPDIRRLIPIRGVINEVCRAEVLAQQLPEVTSFEELHDSIEKEEYARLHFTQTEKQFYQERLCASDGSRAVIFCNTELLGKLSGATLMYVDGSFRIETKEQFGYQLITVLIWLDDSYYPILFALVSSKTQEILRLVFKYLHDELAPSLRPTEIVTDYETNLYYALGETYTDAHIGGSVFYYIQNVYKKVCDARLTAALETHANFRAIYHMLLMLPLLPVNTIGDALNNVESQARDQGLYEMAQPLFDYVRTEWIENVTTSLFCVHRLENRINENVIAPFKKLRDFLLWSKGKVSKNSLTITQVIEKLVDLEAFLLDVYAKQDKKSFGRDLSTSQKKNVLRAWSFIENHPTININTFFTKVSGYIKCMENQLWIWGFYRYKGSMDEELISAKNFILATPDDEQEGAQGNNGQEVQYTEEYQDVEYQQEYQEQQQQYHEQTEFYDETGAQVHYVEEHEEQHEGHTVEEVHEEVEEVQEEIQEEQQQEGNSVESEIDNGVIGADYLLPAVGDVSQEQPQTTENNEALIVMEAVIGQDGQVVLQSNDAAGTSGATDGAIINYVYE